ncbi:MAG: sensor histidine kinase [Defluviitaleaceae bacterium]|nr:sensor histidine kinase [Defluviitaleaceae bacterium]
MKSLVIFLSLVVMLFTSVMVLTITETKHITNPNQLIGFDFSTYIANINPELFNWHPNALYAPEDFATGNTSEPIIYKPRQASFATYRIVLNLSEGTVYGITGYSPTFSMALWVDGVLLESVGVPGDGLENMAADHIHFTAFFAAGAEPTEIIIQRSGFVRAEGGRLAPVFIGERSLITSMNTLNHIRVSISIGVTLMAALLFFGMFLFFKGRNYFLWFSLVCLMITIRTMESDYRIINTLFPNIGWHPVIVLETIISGGFLFFVILYVNAMFRGSINRIIKIIGLGYIVIFTAFLAAAPTYLHIEPQLRSFSNTFIVLVMTAVLINMAVLIIKDPEKRHMDYILVLVGGAANILLGAADAFIRIGGQVHLVINLVQVGALVFVFINIIALAANFRRTEAQLDIEQQKNREIDETNKLLERMGRLKNSFLADISHEMKSPLLTMGGYAELASWHIEAGTADEDTIQNLLIASEEARRLAALVDRLLSFSAAKDSVDKPIRIEADDMLSRVQALLTPLLASNSNRLDIHIEKDCPPIAANPDMVLQVFFNLVGNANRHVGSSTVRVNAERDGEEFIQFTVKDSGTGIKPEILKRVFERGVSSDGSSGLGLPICKDAVEAYGGSIQIESRQGAGTTVRFTLPVYKENEREDTL